MSHEYIDKAELDRIWHSWHDDQDPKAWAALSEVVYRICLGVAVYFCPRNEEERCELAHRTFALVLTKIKAKKIVNTRGRGSFFGLLTTAAFRHLYSLKRSEARRKIHLEKLKSMTHQVVPDIWNTH